MYDAHAAPTDLKPKPSLSSTCTCAPQKLNSDRASTHQRADEPRLEGTPPDFVSLLALQALQTALCRPGRLGGTMPSPSPTAMHLKTQAVAA